MEVAGIARDLQESRVQLPPEAASVPRARRHVEAALGETGLHPGLTDVATLLVSEVVTNAVLHAGTELELHCSTDGACARVAVVDRSPACPPVRRHDPTATTGRGLALVEALAARWGIDELDDGKSVWFEIGEPGEPEPPRSTRRKMRPRPKAKVRFRNLPVEMVRTAIEYSESSLRELALIALEEDREWSPPSLDLGPLLRELDRAAQDRESNVDVDVEFPVGSGTAALARLTLVDESEHLARQGRLLSRPTLPEVTHCRRWLYRQIALQPEGMAPERWELPEHLDPVSAPPEVDLGELASFTAENGPSIIADDANRIVFVDPAAAELLGWDAGELVGRRVTVIVPPEFRESHLAGFAHHQLTGERRLIGTRVNVPILRRDRTQIVVELHLATLPLRDGRVLFAGAIRPT